MNAHQRRVFRRAVSRVHVVVGAGAPGEMHMPLSLLLELQAYAKQNGIAPSTTGATASLRSHELRRWPLT